MSNLRLPLVCLGIIAIVSAKYTPDWPSVDSRPLPEWFDQAKFGIFMHWGVYSVPSFHSEWFWNCWENKNQDCVDFMAKNYPPGFTYADFGPQFTNEFFDAKQFAAIVKASGAKYVVPTSKHHEGFTMYPSNYSWNWNSMDVGSKRDLLGELRAAINDIKGVHFGLYFSQFEWYNRLYLKDKSNDFQTTDYVQMVSGPQLYELINSYQPDVLWSDGDWEATPEYWNSTGFLSWLYNESPVKSSVVTNDRWGRGTAGAHGGYYSFGDRFNPGVLQPHKWESCTTMDKVSWGFRRDMTSQDVLTPLELITLMTTAVSCGGNFLLNVGPTHYGMIPPIFEERLRALGSWLAINGEAIYHTRPWIHQNDTINPDVWYTSVTKNVSRHKSHPIHNPQIQDETIVYAIVLKWPQKDQLRLGAPRATHKTKAHLLGNNHHLSVSGQRDGIKIDLSAVHWTELHSKDAWVIRLQYLADDQYDPTEIWQ